MSKLYKLKVKRIEVSEFTIELESSQKPDDTIMHAMSEANKLKDKITTTNESSLVFLESYTSTEIPVCQPTQPTTK